MSTVEDRLDSGLCDPRLCIYSTLGSSRMLSSIRQRQHDQDDRFVRRMEDDTDDLLQQTQDQQEKYALLQVTLWAEG